jgi:hypothetical protein
MRELSGVSTADDGNVVTLREHASIIAILSNSATSHTAHLSPELARKLARQLYRLARRIEARQT